MLYSKDENTAVPWNGERIDGVGYPRHIEGLWSPEELAAIGLFTPVDPGIPEGKVELFHTVEVVDGVVTVVYALEDKIEPPYTLYRSEFVARMEAAEAVALETYLNALTGEEVKLRMTYNASDFFVSDDPLFAYLHWTVGTVLGDFDRADYLLGPTA